MHFIRRWLRIQALTSPEADEQAAALPPAAFGLFSLTLLGVSATIGTGIFFILSEVVPKAGPAVLLAFLIAGVTAGLTALCYAELAAEVPASGSAYSYAYVTLGELTAFMVAACLVLEYALSASAIATGWSGYLDNFLTHATGHGIPVWLRTPPLIRGEQGLELHRGQINLPPLVLVLLCGLLLSRGARESALANAIMVLIKLAVLVFFAAVAITGFRADNLSPFFNAAGMQGVTAAAGTVFFSFIGLDAVSTAGTDVSNPRRNVPRGILLSLAIVLCGYLMVTVTALGTQPASAFAGQQAGLATILQKVTGASWPAMVLSAGAVVSVFSVTLVALYAQTRILMAVSRDGLLPASLQHTRGHGGAPLRNIVLVCTVVGLIAGSVDPAYLWDTVSMGTLVAFMVVSISVPVLRARLRQQPPRPKGASHERFRLPFGPYLIPGLSLLSCLYIVKDLSHATYVMFFGWMSLALLTYAVYGWHHSHHRQASRLSE